MTDDIRFEEPDQLNYTDKNKITFRDIALQQWKKCCQLYCVEWHGGFWEVTTIMIGQGSRSETKKYVPDTRETFSNSVKCLASILSPYFDDEMRAEEEKINEQIRQALQDFIVKKKIGQNEYNYIPDTEKDISFRSIQQEKHELLFRALSALMHRKKYFEIGSIED